MEILTRQIDRPPLVPPGNGELAPQQNGGRLLPYSNRVNILLVDDREDKLLALEAVLRRLGQNLIFAHSGKDALRCLLKDDCAVILMDVSMPGMDGFETASLIRQRPRSEHTPIIFVTSVGGSENEVYKGYSLGAVDYILTPIVPEVLRAKVKVFVELYSKSEKIKQQAEQLARDNTALKEAERKIQDLNMRLEKQVAALTEVNKELDAFSYSIAHDLRSPLRSMQGFAEILIEDYAPKLGLEGAELARRIIWSSTRLDRLLSDLLAYSRLTSADLSRIPINLDEALADVLFSLEKDTRDKAAVVEVQKPLGWVHGHPATVTQVLANLITNALKFMASGRTPQIQIGSTRYDKRVRLSVQDNGIGIEPEYHAKIFGLFERLHPSQEYPGTGIGLALVRKGVERMGGRVGIESEPGKGSTFWVDLPAYETVEG